MDAETISTVAVIGAGTMGSGIAGLFARAGCDVRLADVNQEALDRGADLLGRAHQALIDAGLLSSGQAAGASGRIRLTTCVDEACDGVELLVEAVSEDLALKQEMFARFDAACPAAAVLASNTSGLSITKIASATGRPGAVAGMHFWNPPHLIPLVEVTKGNETDDATAALLVEVSRRIGKRPVLVRHDIPGFVGNRLQFAVFREALHLLSEGIASAEDIDTAMTAGPGLRYGLLGPLRTSDLGGLDVFHAISSYLLAELSAAGRPPELLGKMVEAGKLGAKSGQGFYAYGEEDLGRILAERDRVLLGFLKVLGGEG